MRVLATILLVVAGSSAGQAKDALRQPYTGLETRAVTTLSADDIAQIEAGKGWGLALPAELNGYPGPAHVLELARDLKLSPDQRARIEAIFRKMESGAIAAGQTYVAAERKVDQVFRSGAAAQTALSAAVAEAARKRGALRLWHLNAHLEAAAVLSTGQRRRYEELRGYRATEPGAHDTHDGGRHRGHHDAMKGKAD